MYVSLDESYVPILEYKKYMSRAGMAGIMLRKRSAINIIKHPVSNILGKSKIITLFQISQKSTRKP